MARILIVENEKLLADALAWILGQEGHEVLVATNAAVGIERGVASRPDLIIAGWMLKSPLHGGEVSQRIRTACPQVKTIIITSGREMALQARTWCNGIDEVIEKPFHKEQMLQAVRRLIPERELFAMAW